MNYVYLRVFIENYSLPTLAISGIVAILMLLYDKFLASKLPTTVRNFLPFLLSTVLYYAYDMVFVIGGFAFSKGTFPAGILSGSLSVIITSSMYKLKSGKPISLDNKSVLVEHLLTGFIKQELLKSTATEIIAILDDETMDKEHAITEKISQNTQEQMSVAEIKALSSLIVKAVISVKQK
jgi:hypothetical protein